MNNKKTKIAIISVVALLLVLIGVTYAYWLVTKTQTNSNIISSACLDITLDNESAAINLGSQYPLADEDGMKLTPYTFTITNNCNTSIDYQVALESIGDEANAIASSAIKVALDNNVKLYSNYEEVATTIGGAYASHKLGIGTLASSGAEGSSATHSLRIWIDENAPISEANKTYQSKISVTIGQGIKASSIKPGTLAYNILENNINAPTVSGNDFFERIQEHVYIYSDSAYLDGPDSIYWYGSDFEYDEKTQTYILTGEKRFGVYECREEAQSCGWYTFISSEENYTANSIYKITNIYYDEIANMILEYDALEYRDAFVGPEKGLYKTVDDLGETYFFSGDVTNNYVQFGTYTTQHNIEYSRYDEALDEYVDDVIEIIAGTPMYWRIVRINGDGTIRLIYDGTSKRENSEDVYNSIGSAIHGGQYGDYDYLNSGLQTSVDTWYNTQLKTNYGSYIADGIFCNDKEVYKEYEHDDANDYYFQTQARVIDKTPQLTCTRAEDRYSSSSDLGNKVLSHPVGLLTVDEAMFAGVGSSSLSYLRVETAWWTMSPEYSSFDEFVSNGYYIYSNEIENGVYADTFAEIRPVINLRADVEFTGDGSFETPYVIKTN